MRRAHRLRSPRTGTPTCTRTHSRTQAKWRQYGALLEAALRRADAPFFCGASWFYCDVALMDSIRETLGQPCFDREKELAPFPLLQAWLQRMESVPAIAAYYAKRGPVFPDFVDSQL